ncbi:unnamed protein product [Rhizoctonia solani]|uniref:Uncharacterized protein n=1 Tax=Rhizoctonia solani TaxID=456999 RepID=A0A8H3AIG0_9AGAM|nr:unnamed protein product [Rhizoctonia solani]
MEYRRNFYGRVYDDWTDIPNLQGSSELATPLRDAPELDPSSTPPVPTSTAGNPTPTSPVSYSTGDFTADLSISVSQGSLYAQLGDWVDPQTHHTSDDPDVIEAGPFDRAQGDPYSEANPDPVHFPLPPSPDIDHRASITQDVDLSFFTVDTDPVLIPPPPNSLIIREKRSGISPAI